MQEINPLPKGVMMINALPAKPGFRVVSGNGVSMYVPDGTRNASASSAPMNARSISEQQSRNFFSDQMKGISDKQFAAGIGAGERLSDRMRKLAGTQVADLRANYADQLALMNRLGGAERDRINRDFTNQANSIGSQLAGTGLYNSTVAGNMAQGVERNRSEALNQLQEMLIAQQLGGLQNLAQGVSAAQQNQMGNQTDIGQMLSALYSSQAQTLPTLSDQQSNSWSK